MGRGPRRPPQVTLHGEIVVCVVDYTVWIDYFTGVENQQTGYLHQIVDKTPVLLGDLILAEVPHGFREDTDFEKARHAFKKYIQLQMVDPTLALHSARNDRTLRLKGVIVRKTIDSSS